MTCDSFTNGSILISSIQAWKIPGLNYSLVPPKAYSQLRFAIFTLGQLSITSDFRSHQELLA